MILSCVSIFQSLISPAVGIAVEAECGIVICDRQKVEMTPETSGLGEFQVV